MKTKRLYILLFLGLLFTNSDLVIAQRIQYSLVPQYFFINGLRTDLDIRIGKNTWINLAPQVYINEGYEDNSFIEWGDEDDIDMLSNDNSYASMFGYGSNLNLIHYFPVFSEHDFQPYLGYGVGYRYYKLDYNVTTWHDTQYEDLPALQYGPTELTTNIDQFAGMVYLGLYIPVDQRFFIEIYIGSKVKYSQHRFTGQVKRRFDDGIFKPGYTGILPYSGVRYGLRF